MVGVEASRTKFVASGTRPLAPMMGTMGIVIPIGWGSGVYAPLAHVRIDLEGYVNLGYKYTPKGADGWVFQFLVSFPMCRLLLLPTSCT